jgi:hypothetical protein
VQKIGGITPLRKNGVQLDPIENNIGDLGTHLKNQIGSDLRTLSRAQLASNSVTYNATDFTSSNFSKSKAGGQTAQRFMPIKKGSEKGTKKRTIIFMCTCKNKKSPTRKHSQDFNRKPDILEHYDPDNRSSNNEITAPTERRRTSSYLDYGSSSKKNRNADDDVGSSMKMKIMTK